MTLKESADGQPPIMVNERRRTGSIESALIYTEWEAMESYIRGMYSYRWCDSVGQKGDSLRAGITTRVRPTLTLSAA